MSSNEIISISTQPKRSKLVLAGDGHKITLATVSSLVVIMGYRFLYTDGVFGSLVTTDPDNGDKEGA